MLQRIPEDSAWCYAAYAIVSLILILYTLSIWRRGIRLRARAADQETGGAVGEQRQAGEPRAGPSRLVGRAAD